MAAKSAIGMMRNSALERIEKALPGFIMPTQGRDPDLLHAQQLEAIADWLEEHQAPIANAQSVIDSLEVVNAKAKRK